jgi:prolyl oligopeptidase
MGDIGDIVYQFMHRLAYPPTRNGGQFDDYHGTRVADLYRWLEDVDSAETRAWIAAQNALTWAYLGEIPARERLRRRLTELWNYPRAEAPIQRGGRYLQLRNTGLQYQDVLYAGERLDGKQRVLLDPNVLSVDGTISLRAWSVSDDGRYLAYGVSAGGSDWITWRVRAMESGQDLPDLLEWSKFCTAAWRPDGAGFYYSRYSAPAGQAYTDANQSQKLYFHRLGEPQIRDSLVYERPDHPDWGFAAEVSADGRYLVVHVSQGTDSRNRLCYQDLAAGGGVVELIAELEASYTFIGNDGPRFYLLTNHAAPRGQIIAVDVTHPVREHWETVIPEGADTLEHALMVNDQFVALYLHDAHHRIRLYARNGTPAGEVALPSMGR